MSQLWLWLERKLEAWTGRPASSPEEPCCEGCAHGQGCAGGPTVHRGLGRFHHVGATSPSEARAGWSSWSWHGRMVLDAEHWRPRPMPRSPLDIPSWANLQESASAQHANIGGLAELTMPLTYKSGKPLAEIYGENLYARRPFGYPQPTPSATWSAPPVGLMTAR